MRKLQRAKRARKGENVGICKPDEFPALAGKAGIAKPGLWENRQWVKSVKVGPQSHEGTKKKGKSEKEKM